MRRWIPFALLLAASPLAGQGAPSQPMATLTLKQAIEEARRNNPAYRQAQAALNPASWATRNAYGALLPTFGVNGGAGYSATGRQTVGGLVLRETPAALQSFYGLGFNWNLSGRSFTQPGQAKANERASQEDVAAADVDLVFRVTDQYLTTLSNAAQASAARQQVQRNEEFLKLARARYQVGQATLIDVRQAEVNKGNADVGLLRALQAEAESKLSLFQQMGIDAPVALEQLVLVDSFAVVEPAWSPAELVRTGLETNPALKARRERLAAAGKGVSAAKWDFAPSLSAQASWSGFTNRVTNESGLLSATLAGAQAGAADCQYNNAIKTGLGLGGVVPDCFAASGLQPGGTALLPEVEQQVLEGNSKFPFQFESQPFQASFTLSLPIWDGFSRSLRVSQARQQEVVATEQAREFELSLKTVTAQRLLGVQTAYKAIAVQDQSRAAARDQLQLAQDRYRLGSGTALELADAQNLLLRAETDYITAVYGYHRAVALLEAIVGRPIR